MVRGKGMIRRVLCAGFFLLLLQVPSVRSTAQLWLQLQTFQNGGPYKYDGSCCDGEAVGRNCTGSCDYSVSICLSSRGKNGTCDLGRSNVGSLDEQGDNFVFPNSFLNGASNPVLLSLPVWGGELHVQVSISDVDTAMEELVDSFNFEFSFEQPVRDRRLVGTDFQGFKLIGTRAREASRLDVALAVRCDTFYYDRNCSTNCVPANDCTGHYECDRVTGAKICLNGWRGVDCNEATGDICGGNNPCENGATCTRYGQYNNNTLCCCARGFTGPTCAQDVDECLSQPCLNGGQCVQGLPNSFSCLCNPRYKGETCSELRTCAENPCLNGGSCFPVASTFFCSCSPRYTGVVCETDTLPPETTTPAPTCPPGYFGPGCSVRCEERDDCGGHYTCDTNTGARRCRTGWQGENCTGAVLQDPLCPCQNGGQCFQGACCCPAGFSGSRCQNRAQQDFCSSQPCRNGGFCINDFDFDRFLCLCPQKYRGRECELLASGRPVCPPDYYGPRCDVFCRSGDDCLAGQWDCDPDTGARVCRFGWTGPNCDVRDPFAVHQTPCPNSVCLNGGICTNNTCCCSPGWTGSLCHIEIVECASNPCLNGACIDLVNDFRCECEVGWAGRQCDIQLPEPLVTRAPNPCDNSPCRNGATCVEGLLGTGVVCLCPDGYRGRLCEEMEAVTAQPPSAPGCPAFAYGPQCSVTCRDRNDCQGHYYCDPRTGQQVCRNGWGGAGCGERLVEPLSDPECALPGLGCLNGGTCFRGGCCCPQGFTGQLCQDRLLPCSSRPCLNGASCLDVEGGYRCACAPGWEGSVCERFVGTPGGTPATSTPPAAYLTEIIYLRGDVNVITRYTQIQDILQSALLVNNPDDNMQIRIIASQIFMDANGTAIVGYTYRRSPGSVLIGGRDRYWDAVDQSLESLTGSPEVFRGDVGTLYGLGSAFTVNVQQLADQGTPVATIAPVIAQAWLQSQPGDWKIVVVGRENFVGSYGVPYTKLTYFVVKDGRLLDSRFYSPPQTSIETAFHNTSSLPPLYQGPQGRPASHTFSLYLGPSFTSTLTSQQGQSLLTSLQTAWAQYLSASDVKIEYLRPVKVMTSNGEMVTRLDYFVVAEGVLQNPMSVRAPGDDVLTRFSVPVCQACRPNPIQPISVEGQVTWSQANQIASDFLGSQNTAGGTNFQREEYVDSNGVPVTRLTLYGPSAPSGALGSGVVVSRLPLRRIYSLDLSGVVTSDRMSAVQEAIRRAWIVNNPRIDQNDISVQVIEMNSSYTDDQNNPVTRVRYTVTVGGADSSLTYGEEPLPSTLSGPLANVGVLLCNCVARQGRVVYVVGTVSQTDRPRLQSAILEAWRAANPAYANQITVDVVNTSTTTLQPSGQQVSWIWYVVEFQSGDLGQTDRDLTPPSQSDLTNRIALTGYVVTSAPPTQATPTSPTVTPTFTVRPPVGGVTGSSASDSSTAPTSQRSTGTTYYPVGVDSSTFSMSMSEATSSRPPTVGVDSTTSSSITTAYTSTSSFVVGSSSSTSITSTTVSDSVTPVVPIEGGTAGGIGSTATSTTSSTVTDRTISSTGATSYSTPVDSRSSSVATIISEATLFPNEGRSTTTTTAITPTGTTSSATSATGSTRIPVIDIGSIATYATFPTEGTSTSSSGVMTDSTTVGTSSTSQSSPTYETGSTRIPIIGIGSTDSATRSSTVDTNTRSSVVMVDSTTVGTSSSTRTSVTPVFGETGSTYLSGISVEPTSSTYAVEQTGSTRSSSGSTQSSPVTPPVVVVDSSTSSTGVIYYTSPTPFSDVTRDLTATSMTLTPSRNPGGEGEVSSTRDPFLAYSSSVEPVTNDVMTTSAPASSNSVTEEVLLTGGATDLPWGVVQEVLRQSLNQTDPANAGRHRLDIIDRRIYVQPNGSVVVSYVYRRSPGNPLPGGQGRFWTVVSQGLASRGSSAQVYSAPVSGLYNVISAYSLDVQGPLSNTDLVANLSQFIARTWSENEPDCRCDWGVIVVGIDEYVGQYGTQYSRLTYFVVRDGSVVDARAVPQPQVLLQESLASQPRLPPPYIGRGGNPVQDSYTLMLSPGAPSRITSPAGVDVLNNLQAAWQAHLPGSNVRIEYAKPTQQFTINGETVTVLTYFVFVNGVRVNPRVTIAPTVNTLNDFRVPACRACVLAPVIPPVNVRGNVTRNEAFEIARDVLGPQVIGFSPTDLKTDQYLDSDGNWVTRVTLYSVRDAVGTPGSGVTIAVAPFTRVYYVDIEGAVGQDRVTTLAEILRRAWVQTNPKINSTDIEVDIRQMDPTFFSERNTPVTRVWYTVTVGGADSSLTYGEEPLPPTMTTLLGEVGLYLCGCLPRKSREIVITGEVTPEKTDVIKEAIENTWREANPDFKGNVTVEITNIDNSGRDTNGRPLGRLWYVVWAEGVAGRQETDDLTPPTQTELTNRVVEAESSTSTPSPTPRPPSVLYIQEEVLLRGANASAVPWERVEEKLRQALNMTDPGNACCVTLDVVGSQVFVDANGSVVIGYTYRRSPNNTLPGGQQRFLDNVDRVLATEDVSTLPTTPPPALLNVTSAFTLTVQSDPGATLPSAETATAIARGWSASDPNCRCSWRVVIVGSDSYLGDFGTPYNNLTYFVVRDGRVLDSKNSTQPVELIRAELARRPDLPDLYPGQPGLPTTHTFSLITAPDGPRTLTSPEGQQLLTSLEAAWKTFLRDPNVKIQPLKPTPGTTSEGDKVAKWDYFVLVNGSALDPRTSPQPTDNFLQLLGVPVCQGCFVTYIPPIDVAGNVTWAAANDIATTVLKDPGPGKRNPEFEQERYIDNDGNPVTRIVLYSPVEDTNPLPPQVTVAKPPLRQLYYMDVQGVLSNDLNTQVALVYAIRRAWAANNPGVPLANISAEVHDMDSNYFDEKGGPVTRVWYTVAVGAADSSVTNAEEPQSTTLRDALKDGGLILCQCHPRPGRQLVVQGQISPNSSSTLADVIASQWRQANPGFQGNVTAQIVSIQNETGPNGERRGRVWYMLWVEGLSGRTGEEELSNLTPPTTTQLEDRLSQVVASVTSSTAPPTPRTTYTPSRATVTPSVAPGSASTLETIYITGNMSGKSQQELQDILGRALNQTDPGNAKGLEVVGTSVFADSNGNVVWAYTVRRYPGTPLPGGQEAYLDQVDQALQDSQTGGATYRGTVATLYGPSSAFRLRMPGLPGQQMDLPVVATSLQEAWRLSDPNCNCEWRVIIVGSEPYVGQYGTQYQQLTYYVVKDGQLVDARVTQAPVDKVQEALAARPPLPHPLTSSQGSPLSHRYSLLLAPGAAERITSAQGRIVLNSLQQSWQSYLQSPVRIDYMKPVQVMTTNGERVTRLDYFVEANGRLLDPLANPAPSPSFFVQRGVPLCQQCVAPSSQPINVQGQITWSQADAIVKEVLGDSYSDMYGDTFSREMFVDSNGHPVTQLRVFSVTSLTRAPGEQVALAVPPLHRVYYVDLQGVVGQERTTAVSEAIRRAWARTNPTIPMYDLQLNNVTLDSKYFNERREPVTRVLYTVAVGGADSSLTNAEEPLPGEIAGALEEGGLSACGCRASRGQRLLVVGEVDPQDTASLKEAITKAWREANPDFKGNLTAEILEVDKNATGVNGENLDALTYVLGLEGMPRGQSESDLTDPSLDQLDAGLGSENTGVTVYRPPSDQGSQGTQWWVILLAILLALLFLLIVIIAVYFILRHFRNRDSRNLKQRPEEIEGFDKEHFSKEPTFNNPTYAGHSANYSQHRTYVVNVDE